MTAWGMYYRLEQASAAGARIDPAFLGTELHTSGMGPTQMTRVLSVSRAAVEKLLRRASEDPAELVPTATGLDLLADVEDARTQVEAATARQQAFTPRWQRLAVDLQDAGLTNRDVAHLMGISRPRVGQLAPRADRTG